MKKILISLLLLTATGSTATAQEKIPRLKPLTAKVGLYGVGHHTYWDQFPGLLDDLYGKMDKLKAKLQANQVEVVDFGIGDKAESAYEVLPGMKSADLDMLFIDMVTYATSSTIAVIFRDLDVPMVMVALQPAKGLDYDNATTYDQLSNDDICSVPEFAATAVRMGRDIPPVIIGTLEDDPQADAELKRYCQMAKVFHDLRRARIGLMGHVLENMYDMQSDPTMFTAAFGCHIVMTEPDDIYKHFRDIPGQEIDAYQEGILSFFDTPDPKSDPVTRKLTPEDLRTAARAGIALEKFVREKDLDGLAYYYEAGEGTEMRKLMTNLIVGNSLLTSAGFPMIGEADLKTCLAMFIMDRLEIGGSLGEFHPIDFRENFVIIGHDGPHHINIADKKPHIRSLVKYHGKPGSGASVEFSIMKGPITMLGITHNRQGQFKFVIAEGQSVEGPVTPIGNTNTRGFFKPDLETFLQRWVAEGPTHHFALGIGHQAKTIKQIADYLDIEAVIISKESP